MMDLKVLASVLWLSHCLTIAFAVSRQFSGSGYVLYDIISLDKNKAINSDVDELSLQFTTVQPSGLLFHARSSGGDFADYVTVEVVGGRLRYAVRYGRRAEQLNDAHEVFLGNNLDDGILHTVQVNHSNKVTTVVLDGDKQKGKEEKVIKSDFQKLEIDVNIVIGGAPDFKSLLSVQSNAYFTGCLTDVIFKPQNPKITIKFFEKDVAVTFPSDMTKGCTFETYAPFTFSVDDSYYKCAVTGLDSASQLIGSFLFRTYKSSGVLLKQGDSNNGFEISYREKFIALKVTIGKVDTTISFSYGQDDVISMNSGNWHLVKFNISRSLRFQVGSKLEERPVANFPANFFKKEVTAGGYVGCMRNLVVNNFDCKPKEDSNMKNVEWNKCNVMDFCVFSPCLHGGTCSQTGKKFECKCSGYDGPVCQFSKYVSSCDRLKWEEKVTIDGNYTLDFDGPGPIKPAQVFCNMSANPPMTRVLTRNIGVKLLPSAGSPISQIIDYIPSLDAAKALARHSERCTQFIEFGCKHARLLEEQLGNWVSADGRYQYYWGGAQPNSKSCTCGETKSCLDPAKKCNCDAKRDVWTQDGGHLNSTTQLPVTEVVFKDVITPGEANYTVGPLFCTGNTSNTATFINEDGVIKLKKWSPPSDGVISFSFRTPYAKQRTLLWNGDPNKDFVRFEIVNETTVRLLYNIGNGVQKIDLNSANKKVNDRSWHKVVIYRNMMEFGVKFDKLERVNKNPLFLKRNLDVMDDLYVGTYQYDLPSGFVGCIRGLTINGEVQDLSKLANEADYVTSGCGAACKNKSCEHGGKCLDNYNVYKCDCSKTPFYGYFCHKVKLYSYFGASFKETESQLTYTYPKVETVANIDIVVGFKAGDSCSGDIIRIDSKDTDQFFLLSLDSTTKKLKFSYNVQSAGFLDIDPPQGQSFCEGRHTFALTRRGTKLNYTIDKVKKPIQEIQRLNGLFSKMQTITIGKKGSKGFKGCITGVKVTRSSFGVNPDTVEPINAFFYKDKTADFSATGLSSSSKDKCGNEPNVPPIPTPRPVGVPHSPTPNPSGTPDAGQRADSDNKTAIIVVVVLILVLLLVILAVVIYWYWARHKGEYHTHEDDEELKGVDPYIDRSAPRKPHTEEPEKKKEWYI